MAALRKASGIFLAVVAAAVVAASLLGEFYGEYLPIDHIDWTILNWFMAASLLLTLVWQYGNKRVADRQGPAAGVSFAYLASNLLFFSAIFLSLWFFSNWFSEGRVPAARPGPAVSFIWISINSLFVALTGITAGQLWGRTDGSAAATPADT